mgnify:CR=1 FL=1
MAMWSLNLPGTGLYQGCVAVCHRGYDHPESVNIGDLGKTQVLEVHLLVDGVQRFLAAGKADLHTDFGEGGVHLGLNLLHQIAPAVA